MAELITSRFLPAQFHIRREHEAFERFHAEWTPTQIITDPNGTERYRIEGFLERDEFLVRLAIGLGRVAMSDHRFAEAAKTFRDALALHPGAKAAPEARYWAGVAAYKATNESGELRETANDIKERWPDSEWATKASIWT